jgi:hypothetical protein
MQSASSWRSLCRPGKEERKKGKKERKEGKKEEKNEGRNKE